MDFFIHNNTTYEIVDNYNFTNNQKISEMKSEDSCYYNLPIAMLDKKKIIIKKLNNKNLMDFLKEKINLHYYSEEKYVKIKFENLPLIYKAWFLFIQKLFNQFNINNHNNMKKYNIKINNMINPADFMIIEDNIRGIIAPNDKKYYLRKHTIDSKYNKYNMNTFARGNIIDILKNSLILVKKQYYKIKI